MSKKTISFIRQHREDLAGKNNNVDQPYVRRVITVSDDGEVFIDGAGIDQSQLRARISVGVHQGWENSLLRPGNSVLVINEDGDPKRPIIIGSIVEKLDFEPSLKKSSVKEHKAIHFKGKQITFESSGQVIIKCGNSTITMKNDGEIVLRGKKIVSRAAQSNKIKGAAVKIN